MISKEEYEQIIKLLENPHSTAQECVTDEMQIKMHEYCTWRRSVTQNRQRSIQLLIESVTVSISDENKALIHTLLFPSQK